MTKKSINKYHDTKLKNLKFAKGKLSQLYENGKKDKDGKLIYKLARSIKVIEVL